MSKKTAGVLIAAFLIGLALTIMVSLIVGVLGACTKILGAPATIACMAAGFAFTGFCVALMGGEDDAQK